MKICVIGIGYVGLVTSVGLTKGDHRVVCVDKDKAKINALASGKIPIYEKGLKSYLDRATKNKLIDFTTDLRRAVESSKIIFIAVGTPELRSGACDLRSVCGVAEQIAKYANDIKIVVIKSTVPVGTAQSIERAIGKIVKARRKSFKIEVVSNPEFLRQGKAIGDFLQPDRIVIGASNQKAQNVIKKLYRFVKTEFVLTDWASAELIKYASNAYLATKISFINEVSNLCEKTGGDVVEVARGMGLDKRINHHFLNAGIGYGGSCFPKDTKALHYIAKNTGNSFKLLAAVIEVNQLQKFRFLDKLKAVLGSFKDKNIGVLGLTFKGDTDDIRESIAVEICHCLLDEKARLKAYDPKAMDRSKKVLPKIKYCKDVYQTAKDADAVLLLTEWQEFRNLDFNKLKKQTRGPIFFDGKNFIDPHKIKKAGFKYFAVGRHNDFKRSKI